MHRLAITCAALLAACGPDRPPVVVAPQPVDPGLLQPCPGWQGPTPSTEGQLIDAVAAERRGRLRCNDQLASIESILSLPAQPKGNAQ